jgi:hypothetical protein
MKIKSKKFKAGILLGLVLMLASFLGGGLVRAQSSSGERITSFESEIWLNPDSSLTVEETIEYDFGNTRKHGIFRKIPYKYTRLGTRYNFRINILGVTSENGNYLPHNIYNESGKKVVKIGSDSAWVTGEKTYVVKYRVERAMSFGDSQDEIYWNATPFDSRVRQEDVQINFYYPQVSEDQGEEEFFCYYGRGNDTKMCGQAKKLDQSGPWAGYQISQPVISPGEGISLLLKLPKGVVKEPSAGAKFGYFVQDNWPFVLPVIALLVMLGLWYFKGRDPEGRGTIVTQFDAPEGLTPMQVGALYDERVDQKDLSAEIINLAIKGYIRIKYLPGQGMFSKDDYRFEKLKEPDNNNYIWEKLMLPSLFNKKISHLKNEFYPIYEATKKEVFRSLILRGYFSGSPNKTRSYYLAFAVIIAFLAFFVSRGDLVILISGILTGIIVGVVGFFMPRKTRKGVEMREKVLGLKRYLEVAEKDRIEFHNAPEKNPKRFEELLPYAMVLGVEEQWAKQFEGIYQRQPDWYVGAGTNFAAITLTHQLGGFQSLTSSNLTARPSSGGSGFSGGGFAGGGGGGGSVGSW